MQEEKLEGRERQARVIQVLEEERSRLAREIHDGPAQVLSNAIFELEYCERILDRDPQALREALKQLKNDIRAGLEDVRLYIFGLRPPTLADLGLFATLRRHVQDYRSRHRIEVEFRDETSIKRRLSDAEEIAVFRIVQEALQNIHKHARASKVSVNLGSEEDTLMVVVEDNGRGFDPETVSSYDSEHLGLLGMRERAELVHAKLEVLSRPGHGTKIKLTLPFNGDAGRDNWRGLSP